ncbi:hypothetical protein [Sphingomonas sp. CFBP 13720]|uniref:hypothetical protein n=1 Tax=Sphingomonas sp. CFBP 13720 TaxID=2775302 RepID=UPI00177C9EBA|nr:hypothetical protein [Sphingomonas sp. CFBP 13720]MBD8679837.1 hypothetical protein [Sphingomonas sp. CFBP 13720]
MIALARRGVALGEARARDAVERVAAEVAAVPGVTVEIVADGVVLSGRGLARRAVSDARLRDLAGWMR